MFIKQFISVFSCLSQNIYLTLLFCSSWSNLIYEESSSGITLEVLYPPGIGAGIAFQAISEVPSKYCFFFFFTFSTYAYKRKMKRSFYGHLYFNCRWRAKQFVVLLYWLIRISCCLFSFQTAFKPCVLETEILLKFNHI